MAPPPLPPPLPPLPPLQLCVRSLRFGSGAAVPSCGRVGAGLARPGSARLGSAAAAAPAACEPAGAGMLWLLCGPPCAMESQALVIRIKIPDGGAVDWTVHSAPQLLFRDVLVSAAEGWDRHWGHLCRAARGQRGWLGWGTDGARGPWLRQRQPEW